VRADDWRSIVVRGLSYAGEHSVRLVLTAIAGILVARYLGPEGLGLLSFTHAVYGMLAPVVLLGLPAILVREFSTRLDWHGTLASAVTMQVPLGLLLGAVGFLSVIYSRDFEPSVVLLAAAMAPLPLLATSETLRSLLEATGRSRVIALTGIAAAVVSTIIKLLAIRLNAELWVFGAAATVEATIITLCFGAAIPSRSGKLRAVLRHARASAARGLVSESWPLLASSIAVIVYMRVDVVMLSWIVGDQETGLYAAAARLSEVWYFLPVAAVAALRPVLAGLYASGRLADYADALQRGLTVAVVAAYCTILAILVAGPSLIVLLYGPPYAPAARILQIHLLAAPFVFLGVITGPWFVDRGLTRYVLLRHTTGAIINVCLNAALVPRLGGQGAAWATFVSYAAAFVLLNAAQRGSRPVFRVQLAALLLRWPKPVTR
jgi:polysaccharide transporter, PST family